MNSALPSKYTSELQLFRVLLLTGGFGFILLHFVIKSISPEAIDPPIPRLLMSLICFGVLGISYLRVFPQKRTFYFIALILYGITFQLFYTSAVNDFGEYYILLIIMVLQIISIGFRTEEQLAFYYLFWVLSFLWFMIPHAALEKEDKLMYGLIMGLLLFANYFIHRVRFRNEKRLRVALDMKTETERQLTEHTDLLEKRNRELDSYSYVISHDLKAPLRAIHSLSEWIAEDLSPDSQPAVLENISLLQGRVRRMENLIVGILEYSRIGRNVIEVSKIDTNQVIHEIIFTYPKDEIEFVLRGNFPVFIGNYIAFYRVLSNLISNAISHNPDPEKTVRVAIEEKKGFYQFSVTDNGPGIEREYHERIFGIFQRIQARDVFESTGIGLAIVKKLVQEEGGTIWLTSTPGEGSTFYFTWPKE